MKTQILFLILILLILSCNKEEETSFKIEYVNNSTQTIKIKPLYFQYLKGKDSIVLAPYETFNDITTSARGIEDPLTQRQFILSDSIEVTYNDTLSIFHGSTLYNLTRDLRKLESYNYEQKATEKHLRYHYYSFIFTNADFVEAKTK